MLELLQNNTIVFLSCTFVFTLLIGSFLNVVIHRVPQMMEREWMFQVVEFLRALGERKEFNSIKPVADQLDSTFQLQEKRTFNLILPNSHCPHCGHSISSLENIPVISYLVLKGRCKACKAPISPRYPIVELVTAVMSVAVAYEFGFTWMTLFALGLTWALIALTMIDFDHKLLPDSITLPLVWAGLIINTNNVFTSFEPAFWGAVAGYLALWSVYWLFKIVTGKEGMGFGDFKLLAALGAWLGWKALPLIIILSSFVGAVVGISLILFLGRDRNIPIPFGPYLAAAGWLALIWGDELVSHYLQFLAV